jgi:hypothetical protein
MKVKSSFIYPALAAVFIIAFIIIYLLATQQALAVSAWWLTTGMLLPAMLASLLIRSVVLRFFIAITFFTQFLGVPWFILKMDEYTYSGWSAVKDFNFTISEFFYVYLSISIFLLLIICFFATISIILPLPSLNTTITSYPKKQKVANANSKFYSFVIAIFIIILTPLNLWMFDIGISLVGIQPPSLPFKLSGGLHYFTKYFVPFLIFYLYNKTSRKFLPASLVMAYALILGTSQISRSATVFILMPVIFFAIMDNRRILLVITSLWGLFCVQVAGLMRNVVYVSQGAGVRVTADTAGIVEKVHSLVTTQFEHIDLLTMAFGIIGRIESPQGLVLGHQFSPEAIGGVSVIIKRFFYQGWVVIDHDAYHLEWIATTLPQGFVSGGGFFGDILPILNSGIPYFVLFALITAIYFYGGEWLVRRIGNRFNSLNLYYALAMVFSVLFFTNCGTIIWWGFVFFLVFLLVTPKIRFALIFNLKTQRV